jgi:hypothetical protein
VTLQILEVLKVRFEDVAKPEPEDDAADSAGGVGAKRPTPAPQDGAGSAAIGYLDSRG